MVTIPAMPAHPATIVNIVMRAVLAGFVPEQKKNGLLPQQITSAEPLHKREVNVAERLNLEDIAGSISLFQFPPNVKPLLKKVPNAAEKLLAVVIAGSMTKCMRVKN